MDRSAIAVGSGMDMPIMHDSDRYELVRGIGSGNFGVARLMRDKLTQELVAVKYIERGDKIADVWYCGVTLYVMLVGAYPFEDPEEPGNFKKTMQRITIPEIQIHEWLLKNLPADLMDDGTMNNQFEEPDQPMQSIQEIMQIISEATIPAAGTQRLNQYLTGSLDIDYEMDEDMDSELDMDSNGEIVYAMCLWRRLLKQDLVRLRVW